jgi:hypothetical protein
MSTVQFFLGMAIQTHLDHAGSGNSQLIGTLGCMLTKNEITNQQEADRDKEKERNETTGRPGHVAC